MVRAGYAYISSDEECLCLRAKETIKGQEKFYGNETAVAALWATPEGRARVELAGLVKL